MFKFEKYQRATLGPSSSDFVATLEKKNWKGIFLGLCGFFKKR